MARCVSLLFVGVICCNILVRGQPPLSPTTGPPSALPPVQAAPDCAVLEPKCKEDIPFKIGESIWWVGKIYIGSSETLLTPGNMEVMPLVDVLPVIDDMPGDPNAKPPVGEKPETPCRDNKCSITCKYSLFKANYSYIKSLSTPSSIYSLQARFLPSNKGAGITK
ncbi:hypothetical protein U1Q18_047144 [Sarracenia purpurea var. burkii]